MRPLLPILALVAAVVTTGCSERSAPTAPVAPPPASTGALWGWVHLENRCGETERFRGGVVVSLEGTSFSTTTDSTGNWRFENLPFGLYTLSFARPGYSSFKVFAYDFTRSEGARLSWFEGLAELPTGVVSNLVADTASVAGHRGMSVSFDLASSCPGSDPEGLILLGATGKLLGPAHYTAASGVLRSATGHFSAFYPEEDLAWLGLGAGSRVFVRAYEALDFGYWNAGTQTWIYTAVSESGGALASVVVP